MPAISRLPLIFQALFPLRHFHTTAFAARVDSADSMDETKIHVIPMEGHWEVENERGVPLASEDSLEDAIRDARAIADHDHIPRIVLHDGDGVTEEIPLADLGQKEHPAVIPPAEEA